jgi:hypothetical protein
MKAKENTNPYNLTPEQLADVEITKAQVAQHLKTIDFNKMDNPSRIDNPTEVEKHAKRFLEFSSILADRKSRNEY